LFFITYPQSEKFGRNHCTFFRALTIHQNRQYKFCYLLLEEIL